MKVFGLRQMEGGKPMYLSFKSFFGCQINNWRKGGLQDEL